MLRRKSDGDGSDGDGCQDGEQLSELDMNHLKVLNDYMCFLKYPLRFYPHGYAWSLCVVAWYW